MSIANAKTATVACILAASIAAAVLWIGDPFLMVFVSPALAVFISITFVTVIAWLLGPIRRAYLHGAGRQSNWGYLGHTVRGETDAEGAHWISLEDCQKASGIPLFKELCWIPESQKRSGGHEGWLVNQAGMRRVLNISKEDQFALNKLRLFLEREVWQNRRR